MAIAELRQDTTDNDRPTRQSRAQPGQRLRDGKPRICHVLHSLNIGGAEVLATAMVRSLYDKFDFVFICLDELGELGQELKVQGHTVELLGRRPGLDLKNIWRMRSILSRHRIDIVHAHQYTPFFYSVTSRFGGIQPPIVFTEHGRHFPDYRRWKRVLLNRCVLRRGDRVVAVGKAVQDALAANEGIPRDRIRVVYNGISTPVAANSSPGPQRKSARTLMDASADDFVVIHVARLDYLKDQVTAIRSVARAAEKNPSVRLVIVGDGPERTSIEHAINELRVNHLVRLMGTRRDVPRLLAAADAFLLTSISEGIPVTILEAMTHQLPVVATDVGGVGEIVHHDTTGLLAKVGDDEQISRHLLTLAGSSQLRKRLGVNAAAVVAQRFSAERMYDTYASLYEEMASHG